MPVLIMSIVDLTSASGAIVSTESREQTHDPRYPVVMATNAQAPMDKNVGDRLNMIQATLETFHEEMMFSRESRLSFLDLLNDYRQLRDIVMHHDANFEKAATEFTRIASTFNELFKQIATLNSEVSGNTSVKEIEDSLLQLQAMVSESLASISFAQTTNKCLDQRQDNLVSSMATKEQVTILHDNTNDLPREVYATTSHLGAKITNSSFISPSVCSVFDSSPSVNPSELVNVAAQADKADGVARRVHDKVRRHEERIRQASMKISVIEEKIAVQGSLTQGSKDSLHFSDSTQDHINLELKEQLSLIRAALQAL